MRFLQLSIQNILLIGITTWLVACIPPAPLYVEPVAGPTASIILTNNAELNVIMYEDAYDCRNQFWIQEIPPGEKRIKVPASREIAFMVLWAGSAENYGYLITTPYCEIQLSMEPAAGKTYRVAFEAKDESCHVQIFDEEQFAKLSESGGDMNNAIVPFHRRKPVRAWLSSGSFCEPLNPEG
jgi:hypothetical protein